MLEAFRKENSTFESYLLQTTDNVVHERLKTAMRYSLENGGKRVRPLLVLATLQVLNSETTIGYPVAAAIEYIHTYSLIHDDLPAMDNDDYRRGQLTNHKKFDEATAILAGDALLTQAFSLVTQSQLSSEQKVEIISLLSELSGSNGMIGGQMGDIFAQGQMATLKDLETIHLQKTGALLRFCVLSACVIANVNESVKQHLDTFAKSFGLAFQIHNDIKDIDQDEILDKSTYVSLLGKDGAIQALENEKNNALLALKSLSEYDTNLLQSFLSFLN